jgi:hypothetical protein
MIDNNEEKLEQYQPFDVWIPRDELIVGKKYLCEARNFYVGTWNGEAFEYVRYKFGRYYDDIELHWDDDPKFGTAKPFEMVN